MGMTAMRTAPPFRRGMLRVCQGDVGIWLFRRRLSQLYRGDRRQIPFTPLTQVSGGGIGMAAGTISHEGHGVRRKDTALGEVCWGVEIGGEFLTSWG